MTVTDGQTGGRGVSKLPKYYVVEAQALPEVFLRVAEAKQMLELGEVQTVNEAVHRVGISRSAFYKYKDAVRPFNDMMDGRIVTIQTLLKDEPGVLSSILGAFAACGGNILTINQTIPVGGCAAVTITAETGGLSCPVETMLHQLEQLNHVIKCEILAG
jgi:chorismate mutase